MSKSFMPPVLCLLFILCTSFQCSDEPEPDFKEYRAISLESISITNDQTSFMVGDTLWINIKIPNTIKDSDGEQLNINQLTDASEAFTYFVLLFKTQYENLARISISENEIINEIGLLLPETYDSQLRSEAILIDGFYTAKHGILLQEPGTFTLKYPFPNELSYGFYSEYNDTLINSVIVETSFRSSATPNEYTFEVSN